MSGSGATGTDPVPSGEVVAQGSFTGLNGQTVSGVVRVYFVSGSGYVVRLEGLSAPSETGLQLIGVFNGSEALSTGLKFTSGNQNYTVSTSTLGTWTSVTIRNPRLGLLPDYGTANLIAP